MNKTNIAKVIAILFVIVFSSCGMNHEEQLVYDYNKSLQLEINKVDIASLEFRIDSIKSLGALRPLDSINYWYAKVRNHYYVASKSIIDTVTFADAYDYHKQNINQYHENLKNPLLSKSMVEALKTTYDNKIKSEELEIKKIDVIKDSFEKYTNMDPNEVLGYKYKATHSMLNPILGSVRVVDTKYYIADRQNSKIITSFDLEPSLGGAEQVYLKECSKCHGSDGRGILKGAKDLTNSQLSFAEKLEIIKDGKNAMIGYESHLTEEQILSVADFVHKMTEL